MAATSHSANGIPGSSDKLPVAIKSANNAAKAAHVSATAPEAPCAPPTVVSDTMPRAPPVGTSDAAAPPNSAKPDSAAPVVAPAPSATTVAAPAARANSDPAPAADLKAAAPQLATSAPALPPTSPDVARAASASAPVSASTGSDSAPAASVAKSNAPPASSKPVAFAAPAPAPEPKAKDGGASDKATTERAAGNSDSHADQNRSGRRTARRPSSGGSARRRPKKIRDARVVYVTADEMKSLPLIIHKFHKLAVESGAIQLVPPADWEHPRLRLRDESLFYVREQTMPVAPFKPDFRKRVVKIDEFPASEEKVSLVGFKSYGREMREKLGFDDIPTTFGHPMSDKYKEMMLKNEDRFFDLMANGDKGEEITLKYGVDVEAEGAFDPQTRTYDRLYDQYGVDVDVPPIANGAQGQGSSGLPKVEESSRQEQSLRPSYAQPDAKGTQNDNGVLMRPQAAAKPAAFASPDRSPQLPCSPCPPRPAAGASKKNAHTQQAIMGRPKSMAVDHGNQRSQFSRANASHFASLMPNGPVPNARINGMDIAPQNHASSMQELYPSQLNSARPYIHGHAQRTAEEMSANVALRSYSTHENSSQLNRARATPQVNPGMLERSQNHLTHPQANFRAASIASPLRGEEALSTPNRIESNGALAASGAHIQQKRLETMKPDSKKFGYPSIHLRSQPSHPNGARGARTPTAAASSVPKKESAQVEYYRMNHHAPLATTGQLAARSPSHSTTPCLPQHNASHNIQLQASFPASRGVSISTAAAIAQHEHMSNRGAHVDQRQARHQGQVAGYLADSHTTNFQQRKDSDSRPNYVPASPSYSNRVTSALQTEYASPNTTRFAGLGTALHNANTIAHPDSNGLSAYPSGASTPTVRIQQPPPHRPPDVSWNRDRAHIGNQQNQALRLPSPADIVSPQSMPIQPSLAPLRKEDYMEQNFQAYQASNVNVAHLPTHQSQVYAVNESDTHGEHIPNGLSRSPYHMNNSVHSRRPQYTPSMETPPSPIQYVTYPGMNEVAHPRYAVMNENNGGQYLPTQQLHAQTTPHVMPEAYPPTPQRFYSNHQMYGVASTPPPNGRTEPWASHPTAQHTTYIDPNAQPRHNWYGSSSNLPPLRNKYNSPMVPNSTAHKFGANGQLLSPRSAVVGNQRYMRGSRRIAVSSPVRPQRQMNSSEQNAVDSRSQIVRILPRPDQRKNEGQVAANRTSMASTPESPPARPKVNGVTADKLNSMATSNGRSMSAAPLKIEAVPQAEAHRQSSFSGQPNTHGALPHVNRTNGVQQVAKSASPEKSKEPASKSKILDEEVLDGGDGTVVEKSSRRRSLQKSDLTSNGESPAKRPRTNPISHVGNINKNGLLRHSPASPGINRPMFYVGVSGTKFCFHTEDMYLNSISYLHRDSAIKNWYVVPSSQAELVEEYAKQNVFDRSLLQRSTANELLAAKTTMLDPREMAKFGIDVFRVLQTPGTFVVTAPQGYHGGFNNGCNIAEAVNFANPDWFEFGRRATVQYAKQKKESPVPFEYLIFQEGYSILNRFWREGMDKLQRDETVKAYARVVVKELRKSFLEGEKKVREYVSQTGSKILYVHELEKHSVLPLLHMSFGNGAGIICSTCNFKSHFYSVVCGCCMDKAKARCVEHFEQGKLCRKKGHVTIVVRRHNPYFLLRMLEVLEKVGGMYVSSDQMLERFRMMTENWQVPELFADKGTGLRFQMSFSTSRIPLEVEKVEVEEPKPKEEVPETTPVRKRNREDSGGDSVSSVKRRKNHIREDEDDDDDFE